MYQDLQSDYQKHIIRNRRRNVLKKIVSVIGCLVVFCTTYALILPAITMENKAYCGEEEHVHSETCYRQTAAQVLVCSAEHFEIHSHDAGCYAEDGRVNCGMADYLIHSHDENCYDQEGHLVCTLTERGAHVHGDACYAPGETQEPVLHVHSETCYIPEQGELVCEVEECEGHDHDADCYAISDELTCTLDENHVHGGSCYTYPLVCTQSTDPHSHGDGCYGTGNLLCDIMEAHVHAESCWETVLACDSSEEGHEHGNSCYTWNQICTIPENHAHSGSCYESIVVCGREEGHAHNHGDGCYSTEAELVCAKVENHVHDTGCYRQNLICEIPESSGHVHEDACYQWNDVLGCGLEEGVPEPTEAPDPVLVCVEPVAQIHIHGEACFEEIEPEFIIICGNTEEDHAHTPECYEISCGLVEHTHTMACWSDPEADVESPAVWEATFADVELTGNWNEDVVAIARTQLGYTESTRNYAVWEDETIHGYTRYGAWYGVPHGDWCGMFVSFCIYYADVQGMPLNYGVRPWIEELTELELYHVAEEYEPKTGDLIFYDWEGDDLSDHVGLVAEIIPATETEPVRIKAIEGNSSNCVQYVYYDLDDPQILGYSELPENEELYFCGTSGHIHNEYCMDGCAKTEHVHDETCLAEPMTYYCGWNEHTHGEECLDEEGNQICGLEEHSHDDSCLVESVTYYCGLNEHTHSEDCLDEAGNQICGLEEHSHDDSCLIGPVTYYCGLNEHTHSEECLDEDGNQICGLEEHSHDDSCLVESVTYYCGLNEHTHSEDCLDDKGNQICGLEEHIHDDSCLIEPVTYYCGLNEHTHSDECVNEEGALICGLTEHAHTEECTVEPPVYYCGKEEHIHGDACFADGNLVCTKETHLHTDSCLKERIYYCGKEVHTHEDACYDTEGNLICTLEEHTHTEECTVQPVYYCGQEEHIHGDDCYDTEGNLICLIPEHTHNEACRIAPEYLCGMEEHIHGTECYDAEGNLICTIPEHTHTAVCLGYTCGLETHSHGSACYDAEGNLLCQIPEHEHDDLCDNYICGKIPHTHGDSCHDAEGNLICSREEHSHSAECLAFKLNYEDDKITVALTITGVEELPEAVQLKVWPVDPEEEPAVYGSMSDAVRERMTTEDRYVSNVGIYEMQLLLEEAEYTLPDTAVVEVDVQFADPLFSQEEVAISEGMQTFTLTPDPNRTYAYVEEPEVVEPEPEEPDEAPSDVVSGIPMSVDSGRDGVVQAVPLSFNWKDTFVKNHVAYALEDAGDISEPAEGEAGDASDLETPVDDSTGKETFVKTEASQTLAYQAEAPDEEDIVNTNIGITGVSFRSSSVGAFAVALADTTQTGSFWTRVTSTSELTADGTYMIVSAEGNYALIGNSSSNYEPVMLETVKGNTQYYTIRHSDGETIGNSYYWTFTRNGNTYSIRNQNTSNYIYLYTQNTGSYWRPNYVYHVLSQTKYELTLSYETPENCWRISRGSEYLRNMGTGLFTCGTGSDGSYGNTNYYYTRDMLIFKLSDVTSLSIPADVTFSGSSSGDTEIAPDKPDYGEFITPSGEKTGDTNVNDGISGGVTVDGKYYSDPATSNLEVNYRKNSYADSQAIDGKVMTDKSVIYGDDDYNAFGDYTANTFGVTLSALGQAYPLPYQDIVRTPVDVVFVLDVSGSMSTNESGSSASRAIDLVTAVNASMDQIMKDHEANRVGIALYSTDSWEMLPLDRYTLHSDSCYVDSCYNDSGEVICNRTDHHTAKCYDENGVRTCTETSHPHFTERTLVCHDAAHSKYLKYQTSSVNFQPTNYTRSNVYKILGNDGLRNEDGVSFANVGSGMKQGLGTYTQAGIARGRNLFAGIGNDTTYTTRVGEGENIREYTVIRQPVFILLSDGEPTHSTNNFMDVLSGPHYGDGTATGSGNGKGIHGYNTILSANYYKRMIAIQYQKPVLFYSIGMGINESGDTPLVEDPGTGDNYKRAVLNPTAQTISLTSQISGSTTIELMKQLLTNSYPGQSVQVTSNFPDEGTGVPHVYTPALQSNPYTANYSYADRAFFGELPANELKAIFDTILKSSVSETPYGFVLYQNTSVTMTDYIGAGMEVKGTPVLRYAGVNYYNPTVTNMTVDGTATTKYTYSGSFRDPYDPNKEPVDISTIEIYVTPMELTPIYMCGNNLVSHTHTEEECGIYRTYLCGHHAHRISCYENGILNGKLICDDPHDHIANGCQEVTQTQRVQMIVPDSALPIYNPELIGNEFYYEALPVRLIYQVGLTQDAEDAVLDLAENGGELTFYTNRWGGSQEARSDLLPSLANPFYYDQVDDEGITTSYASYTNHTDTKASNTTQTESYLRNCHWGVAEYQNQDLGHVYHELGNNGKLVFSTEVMDIPVEKAWADVPETETLPDTVEMTLYKVTEPETAGAVPEAEAFRTIQLTAATEPAWSSVFADLPLPEDGWYYAIAETPVDGYETIYAEQDTVTISVVDPNAEEPSKIQIQAAKVAVATNEDGTITAVNTTVTNQYLWDYALPKTGGEGLHLYYVLGMLLCSVACTWNMCQVINKKAKKERG